MGYGHLRAAYAIAEKLGTSVLRADQQPWANPSEVRSWNRSRRAYEALSRLAAASGAGRIFRPVLDRLTAIPPIEACTSEPGLPVRRLNSMIESGFGRRLGERLDGLAGSLVTTFYAPAIAAERWSSIPVWCVITDSDFHRVWLPLDPRSSRISYLVPSSQVANRLSAYGVGGDRIFHTGFPLPPSLSGYESDRLHHARLDRLERLCCSRDGEENQGTEGQPLRITLAIGGAGAQTRFAKSLIRSLATPLREGSVTLELVAGTQPVVARGLSKLVEFSTRPTAVNVLFEPDFSNYFSRFNDVLATTDLLITKPSELTFYAALGLPIAMTAPLGDQERANRDWLLDHESGLVLFDTDPWRQIRSWRDSGDLSRVARNGFERLPGDGTEQISEILFKSF